MRTYRHAGYTLTLEQTDKRDGYNHVMVKYTLKDKNGVIFTGDDLGASPMHAPESKESAEALLSFLTCMKGDVEEDYFKDYTPRQIAFRDNEAEALYTWRERLNPAEFK